MSSRSWGHGQTFVGGAIAGLALSYRPWLIFGAGVTVGVLLVLVSRFWRRAGELAAAYLRGRGAKRARRATRRARAAAAAVELDATLDRWERTGA